MNPEFPHFERKEQEEKKDWGVALALSKECEDEAFRLKDELLKSGIPLAAELGDNPHITLFQGEFPVVCEKEIEQVVTETFETYRKRFGEDIEFQMEDRLYWRRQNNNVFWNVEQNEALVELHQILSEGLRSVSGWGIMRQFRERLQHGNLSEAERKNIEEYGVLSAGKLFLPHVTIGKLARSADGPLLESIQTIPARFRIQDVIIGHIDRFGQVAALRTRLNFKKD